MMREELTLANAVALGTSGQNLFLLTVELTPYQMHNTTAYVWRRAANGVLASSMQWDTVQAGIQWARRMGFTTYSRVWTDDEIATPPIPQVADVVPLPIRKGVCNHA